MEQQQQQTEEVITDVALTKQDESTVKILQEDDLKTLKEAVEKVKGFKRKYTLKKLTVTDITDKAQTERLRLAIADVRTTKTGLDKDKKEKSKPYRDTVAYINENYDKVIDSIELTILNPLKEYKKEVDGLIEAKEKEDELKKEHLLNERRDKLIAAGIKMGTSGFYEIGSEEFGVDPITLGVVDIQTMTDGIFENILDQVVEKAAIINQAQANKDAADKKAKEEEEAEQERLRLQRIKDQAQIDAYKKALEDEKAEMRRNRIEARTEQLEILGMTMDALSKNMVLGAMRISYDYMGDAPASDWSRFIADFKLSIKENKEKAEKEAARKLLVEKRSQELISIGMIANKTAGGFDYDDIDFSKDFIERASDIDWESSLAEAKSEIEIKEQAKKNKIAADKVISDKAIADKAIADKKVADDLAEKNRIEALNKQGDAAVWSDFISRLKAITYPEVKSNDFHIKVNDVRKFIDGLK